MTQMEEFLFGLFRPFKMVSLLIPRSFYFIFCRLSDRKPSGLLSVTYAFHRLFLKSLRL